MNSAQRITNLDFIRGIALMGILVMNVISFGLPDSAYMNHLSYGVHALTSVVERLVVLDFGRIIASGAPNKVIMMDEVREIYLGMEA